MDNGKRPVVSIDSFIEMADRIIDGIPDRFLIDLNGGFNITEECKKDGEYYIMGEYTSDDMLGSVIIITGLLFFYWKTKAWMNGKMS